LNQLRAKYRIPESLDDNVIEAAFSGNEEYRRMYDEERAHLSKAILEEDSEVSKQEVANALAVATARRERFFVGDYEGWSALEDAFLALEGSAMWVQFHSARELAPPGEPWFDTLIQLSRQTGAWSQEEGLALFLLMERFQPDWPALYFTPSAPPPPFKILGDAIGLSSPL
jgi:hypothetical protein